jgi:hypothetical protein
MRKFIFIFLLSFSLTSGFCQPKQENSSPIKENWSLGLSLSTTGIGINAINNFSKGFDVRFNASFMGYSYNLNKLTPDLQGKARARIGSIGCYLDYYPLAFLYITGGVAYNLCSVSLKGQLTDSVEIGDVIIEPLDIGIIKATIEPGWKINPYLGIGANFRLKGNYSIGIETGLFYMRPPDVTLNATGMLEPTASKEQELLMEKNISPIDFYPNISILLTYRLN